MSVSAGKRKTLHDFFDSAPRKSQKTTATTTLPQFKAAPSIGATLHYPPGLSVRTSFVTVDEETELLAFLDAQPWRTDLARRTMHYGGTFCLMPPRDASPATRKKVEATILKAQDIPSALDFVVNRMVEQGLYEPDQRPQFCIVNEYKPGQGISAHVENFRFDEPVCSLTLAGADSMRFHELTAAHDGSVRTGKASTAPKTGKRTDVHLDRRSLAVLTGDARNKWQHEIVRGRKTGKDSSWRRVSLTFRVEKQRGRRVADAQRT